MIRRLRGELVEADNNNVTIDAGGVGYLVHMSNRPTDWALGDEVIIHTYQAVRENSLDLYGFTSTDELAMFEQLLTLPKIGPKSAAGILSQASLPLLFEAITQQDPGHLSKLSGIGKKTAETIVQGLAEKLELLPMQDGMKMETPLSWQQDVVDALIQLGYPQKDARDTVFALEAEITSTEMALKEALKRLSF